MVGERHGIVFATLYTRVPWEVVVPEQQLLGSVGGPGQALGQREWLGVQWIQAKWGQSGKIFALCIGTASIGPRIWGLLEHDDTWGDYCLAGTNAKNGVCHRYSAMVPVVGSVASLLQSQCKGYIWLRSRNASMRWKGSGLVANIKWKNWCSADPLVVHLVWAKGSAAWVPVQYDWWARTV